MKKFKYLSVILAVAFGLFIATPNAGAVTIAELMAQIQALQAQLAQLQAQQGTTTVWCHDFNVNLRIDDFDNNDLGDVYALHEALKKEGFDFPSKVTLGGLRSFDEETASAVSEFQEKYASEILTPYRLKRGTGFVGKSTRAKLNKLYGCQNQSTNPPAARGLTILGPKANTVFQPDNRLIKISGIANGIGWNGFEGQVGTVTLIDANGMKIDEAILSATSDWMKLPTYFNAEIHASGIKTATGYLVFKNENAKGLTADDRVYKMLIKFKFIDSPVINGVNGPQTLNVNQMGTWTVKASSSNGGNLSYSVLWGDEVQPMGSASENGVPASAKTQQTATFTHTYSQAKIYNPTFYVGDFDNQGVQNAQTSLSVNVGNTTTPSLTITTPSTLPNAKVGASYYINNIDAVGGINDYTWKVSSGSLPLGLSIAQAECFNDPCKAPATISGTPVTAGLYTFVLALTSGSQSVSKQFTLNVDQVTTSTTLSCTDTDGGDNPNVKGTAVSTNSNGGVGTSPDVCHKDKGVPDDGYLTEFSCASNGGITPREVYCAYGCNTGACLPAQRVTLVSPNGGETLIAGQPFTIKWQAWGITNVGASLWNWATKTATGYSVACAYTGGLCTWTLPSSVPAGQYFIRVGGADIGTANIHDDSDAAVNVIVPSGGLGVTSSQYSASILENVKAQLDLIQKAINDWR